MGKHKEVVEQLPQRGGSYRRQPDGSLVPNKPTPEPTEDAAPQNPVKNSKE